MWHNKVGEWITCCGGKWDKSGERSKSEVLFEEIDYDLCNSKGG